MRRLKAKFGMVAASALLLTSVFGGFAFASNVKPLGLNETRTYPIQIYATTGGFTADVTRPLTANGNIKANLSNTSGVLIRVCDRYGSVLSHHKACYNGTTTVFMNSYGGQVSTRPEAKAINAGHKLQGTWIYRFT